MKYCSHCGHEVGDEAVVCTNCGCALDSNHVQGQEKTMEPMAIIGLVLSFVISIAGLIVSIIAYKNIKKDPTKDGKGLATAGIVVSSVALGGEVISILAVVVWYILIFAGLAATAPVM